MLPLSRFQGGGIWVAATGGRTPLNHRGATLEGEVLPVSQRAVAFDPHRVHATQAWKGTRIVLIGYTVRGCERLSEEQRAAASNLGFVLPPPEPAPAPAGAAFDSFPVVLEPVRPPKGAPCCARPSRARAYRVEPASFCSGSDEACQRYTFPPPRGFPGLPGFSRAEVRGLLLSMPPGRFVISSTFPDFDSALDSAPGWLDLFSGSRGFAKSLAASAPCWVLCLDISHGEDEDLLSENLQNLLLKLVSAKAFAGVSAGPVCSSFSSAITSAGGLGVSLRESRTCVRIRETRSSLETRCWSLASSSCNVQRQAALPSGSRTHREAGSGSNPLGRRSKPRSDGMLSYAKTGLRNEVAQSYPVPDEWSIRRGEDAVSRRPLPPRLAGQDKKSGVSWTKLAISSAPCCFTCCCVRPGRWMDGRFQAP